MLVLLLGVKNKGGTTGETNKHAQHIIKLQDVTEAKSLHDAINY